MRVSKDVRLLGESGEMASVTVRNEVRLPGRIGQKVTLRVLKDDRYLGKNGEMAIAGVHKNVRLLGKWLS